MYVKSIAVLAQVLCIVSLGPLADSCELSLSRLSDRAEHIAHWRKRLLVIAAYTGSITCSLILLFSSSPHSFTPILTAILTIIGNAAYGTSIVCANAFLPGLAREDPVVQAAFHALPETEDESDLELVISRTSLDLEQDEGRRLLPSPIPEVAASVITAISTAELADTPISPNTDTAHAHYHALLSITTSRISSIATALGFLSGVSVLALLIIPVTLMGGTTSSLRLAVGVSAIWWAVFTIPAWRGLPGGSRTKSSDHGGNGIGLGQGWKRVGGMIKPSEIRQLPNLFTFLLAWIFLSDGMSSPSNLDTQRRSDDR
jgi:UMF1 family MFS transporter